MIKQLNNNYSTIIQQLFNNYSTIKCLGNGIFIKSNTKHFTEFTDRNLSQRLAELTVPYFLFNDVEECEFPLDCAKSYLNPGGRFFSPVT